MNQINYILIVLTILCSNVLAQQDTNNSNVQKKIQTYKDTQVIYQTGPDGVNAGPYLELEGFEDPYFPPADWELVAYNFNWEHVFGFSNSGSRSAAIFCDSYNEAWLITPAINLIAASTPYLKYFEYVEQYGGYDGYHDVLISTDYTGFGDPNSANWDYLYGGVQNYFSWDSVRIDLSYYNGLSNVRIAFLYLGNGDEEDCGTTWFIDDVVVDDPCLGTEPVPDSATIASPPDGATSLHSFVSFDWYPPIFDVSKQFYYVGTDGGGITTPTNVYNGYEYSANTIGVGPVQLLPNTTYYWQIIPANCNQIAVNCPIWSFTTNDGEVNFGAGATTQGGYYFANSTAGASGAPSQPIYSWVDISTGNDLIGSIADDQTLGPFPLGFTFNYFGIDYTEFYISANGFIAFSDATGYTSFPDAIPATRNPDNHIAGYWKDLDPTNLNVLNKHLYYGQNSGDMVITFENYPQQNANANGWITFQIIIKPSGNIKIQYQNSGSTFDTNGGTVGIENSDGTEGILYRHRQHGGVISNSMALEFGTNSGALPVELTSFSATNIGQGVKLNWTTETEVNNYGFEIERKASPIPSKGGGQSNYQFEKIGFVNGNGNSNSPKNYSFDDPDIQSGKHHYRLKQIDNDGKFVYSNTIEVELNIPLEYQLAQNYPNPFNPSTKINYQIPKAGNVALKVYDVLGNEVATLVDEYREAGDYELNFDAGKLSGGVYFYQLNTGGFSQTRKMLLLK